MTKNKLGTLHSVDENLGQVSRSQIAKMVIAPEDTVIGKEPERQTERKFLEVPLEEIIPRSVNRYSQQRIDRLARSIRNTNNRLIHPVVLVKVSDLPETSDVIQKFKEKGTDLSGYKYIIVAGERRYRAFSLLRNQEENNPNRPYYEPNPFETITANVLTRTEAKNENAYYEDSNVEARQLSPVEGILHIRDALDEVKTNEDKRQVLLEMNTYLPEGQKKQIPEDADAAAQKFNQADYCMYYLDSELGITSWSYNTVKMYLNIVHNCDEKIIDAIIEGTLLPSDARYLLKFTKEFQVEALGVMVSEGRQAFEKKIGKKAPIKTEKKRFDHADAQNCIKATRKSIVKDKNKLEKMLSNLGTTDKKTVQSVIKKYESFVQALDDAAKDLE